MFDIVDDIVDFFMERIQMGLIKRVGAFFRYLFLFHKYSYKQVLQQEYNGRVGIIVTFVLVLLLVYWHEAKA